MHVIVVILSLEEGFVEVVGLVLFFFCLLFNPGFYDGVALRAGNFLIDFFCTSVSQSLSIPS